MCKDFCNNGRIDKADKSQSGIELSTAPVKTRKLELLFPSLSHGSIFVVIHALLGRRKQNLIFSFAGPIHGRGLPGMKPAKFHVGIFAVTDELDIRLLRAIPTTPQSIDWNTSPMSHSSNSRVAVPSLISPARRMPASACAQALRKRI